VSQKSNKRAEELPAGISHDLWKEFVGSEDQDEYCRSWTTLQCSIISGAVQGVLFLDDSERGSFTPVTKWPEEGEDPGRLAEISERVIEEQCGLLVELNTPEYSRSPPRSRYALAYPVIIDEKLQGVFAVEVIADTDKQLKHSMEQLQWGISWIEILFRRRQVRENDDSLKRMKSAVDMMAVVLSERTYKSAGMAFVTELATRLGCDRVSLAFIRRNHARIQAVSHSSQIGERMNLIRAIETAMDESIVQRREIYYPIRQDAGVLIVRDHEQLAKQHGAGSILTMPFYGEGGYEGAITLERPPDRIFRDEDVNFCRSVASLLIPVLEAKRQNDRFLILKVWDALKTQMVKLFGSGYQGRKVLAFLFVAVVAFFSLKMADYRISAEMVLEGAVRRSIVAPFEGYVKEAHVRAGDVVESGTVMCTLDDRDLNLERLNWLSRQTQYQRQYQEAMAEHNRAEAEIIKAQLDQAAARLNLVESQLERTRIIAPFRGIVLSGDLSQRLGGAAEKGEVLFEVAPLDEYRVILEVDERRIADVKVGQHGHMILSALPHDRFDFVINRITPISTAEEGLNFFRVEAGPETISERLRPGMTGIGKIYVGRQKLIYIWTKDLREWLRIWAWSWWP
jgi:multidrug efflux pump subunit AcrA (membrane-fusion protein)